MNVSHRPNLMVFALLLGVTAVSAEGCQAIEGIFKAGFFVGIIIAVIVVGLVVTLFSRMRS